MIITKTPYRISFFGGGTDYPEWFKNHSGSVISTTIDKYCYINLRNLPPFFNYKYRLRYFKKEEVKKISEIKHPSIRESLNFMNMSWQQLSVLDKAYKDFKERKALLMKEIEERRRAASQYSREEQRRARSPRSTTSR